MLKTAANLKYCEARRSIQIYGGPSRAKLKLLGSKAQGLSILKKEAANSSEAQGLF